MSIEAMKQALEALERIDEAMPFPVGKQAITSLRQAIAEAEKQEPVPRVVLREGSPTLLSDKAILPTDERLYTHPQPKREWVGLTEEEIEAIAEQARSKAHAVTLTIKALKEKNT